MTSSAKEVKVLCLACGTLNDGHSNVCINCQKRLIDTRPLTHGKAGPWSWEQYEGRKKRGLPYSNAMRSALVAWAKTPAPLVPRNQPAQPDSSPSPTSTLASSSRASNTYFLRAIALAILSIAAGTVIIGFAQGFVIGFAATSDSLDATNKVATMGGIAIVIGSLVAIAGLVSAFTHYQTGTQIQAIEDDYVDRS